MGKGKGGSLEREGIAALTHMETALELLDRVDLPIEVAAHLDLAIHRLRQALQSGGETPVVRPPSG